MPQTLTDRYEKALKTLQAHGQEHLLAFYDQLDEPGREQLLSQVEAIDWDEIDELIDSHVRRKPLFELPEDVKPAPYYPLEPRDADQARKYDQARQRGEEMLRQGKVGCFVVAGGSGTRLGWDGPKGTFPASPVEGKPLFQMFAEYIRRAREKYGVAIPWYIMTSPANDAPTQAFFQEHDCFGLPPADVVFFQQGTMPSIGHDGRVLLADKDALALNADGHGGSLKALWRAGAIDDMQRRGVEYLSYFQVDNPIVKFIDPLFLGLHALDNAQMSSKMVAKQYGMEKLGNFCLVNGELTVVEYSDLPEDLAEQRTDDGELRFRAGSPAIHVISRDFVRQLNASGRLDLPFHRADKKVPHVDVETGKHVEPDEPNAVKLEMFVFDALPKCQTSIILETDRKEEMAFIKNATGDSSPESSKQDQTNRNGRWLEQVGVTVPRDDEGNVDAVIEISYLTAIAPDDLREADLPDRIQPGETVVI